MYHLRIPGTEFERPHIPDSCRRNRQHEDAKDVRSVRWKRVRLTQRDDQIGFPELPSVGPLDAGRCVVRVAFGAGTLFVANYAFVHITYRSARARRILEGSPSVLLRNGQPDEKAMRREAINETELADIALEHGFSDLHKVGLIVIETSGQFVCLDPEQAKRLRPQMLEQPG